MLDPWQPSLDPEWAIAVVVFAADYAVVARSYRRRGVPVQRARWALFAAGLAVIAVALLSPIEHLALTSMLSFHLLQNVMIADWPPPLLILGLLTPMVLAIDRLRVVRRLAQPAGAMLLWLGGWECGPRAGGYEFAPE